MPLYFYLMLTLLIELPIVVVYFRRQWKLALIIGFFLNLLTWPLLHLLLIETNIKIYILEILVAIVEAAGYLIFMKCTRSQAIILSFIVNGMSYGAGLLLN